MLKTENYSLVLLLILKISKIIALFHPIAVPRVITLIWLLQNWADPNQGSNLWCTSVLVLLWLSPSPSSHMGGVLFQWHVRDQSFVGCFKISIIVVLLIHGIRLGICRDRRDRRSCKIFVSCVNFSIKQHSFSHILQVYTHLNVNCLHNC